MCCLAHAAGYLANEANSHWLFMLKVTRRVSEATKGLMPEIEFCVSLLTLRVTSGVRPCRPQLAGRVNARVSAPTAANGLKPDKTSRYQWIRPANESESDPF